MKGVTFCTLPLTLRDDLVSDTLLVIILKSPTEYGIYVIYENDYGNKNQNYTTLNRFGGDLT